MSDIKKPGGDPTRRVQPIERIRPATPDPEKMAQQKRKPTEGGGGKSGAYKVELSLPSENDGVPRRLHRDDLGDLKALTYEEAKQRGITDAQWEKMPPFEWENHDPSKYE